MIPMLKKIVVKEEHLKTVPPNPVPEDLLRYVQITVGDYEYIDMTTGGKRHIIEVNIAVEFKIFCPTRRYATLIGTLRKAGDPEASSEANDRGHEGVVEEHEVACGAVEEEQVYASQVVWGLQEDDQCCLVEDGWDIGRCISGGEEVNGF